MECTVRTTTINDGIVGGEENGRLEVEKLQRLVQSLQEKNEKLMAAVGSNNVVLQNGGDGQQQRRTTTTTTGVDPPRDSGIDLSASCSDDFDDDILDLDRFDMPDDEESWLYSTPAAKSQGDVLSWLRKDVNSLDPAARRALAIKLEILIAKKHSDALREVDSKCSTTTTEKNVDDSSSLARLLDFGDEGLCSEPAPKEENLLSPERESGRVIARRTTFRVERKSTEAAAAAVSASANSATYSRPKKTSTKEQTSTPSPRNVVVVGQQKQSTPALAINDESISGGATSPGRKATLEAIHPELNPDMHDIQLLASMQEEELRRCLQHLQQTNRRRRTSSGNQKDGDASPVTPQPNANGATAMATPVIPAKASDRYATYTKPKQHLTAVEMTTNGAADGGVASKAGAVAGRKVASSTTQPQGPVQSQAIQDVINAQKVTGLQKSLPNLSGSRSEFNLPAPSFPVDTASEKGSYGDIPSVLNPPNRSQATTSSTSRLLSAGSRLPTPSRSRLPTPSKSGIPMARSGPSLPVPSSASRRTKSPATKPTIANTPKSQPARGNWNEGCF